MNRPYNDVCLWWDAGLDGLSGTRTVIDPIAKERDRTSTKPASSTSRARERAVWNARAESTRYL